MEYRLPDLIDVLEIQKLLQDFHKVAGIPAAIIDLDGVVLVSSPWQKLCKDFHRVNVQTRCRCLESDTRLANSSIEGNTFSLYRCPNGLMDAASPIVIEGEHLANMFIGQFFTEKPDMDFFLSQAGEFGFDKSAYLGAVSEIPVVAESSLPPILSFLTSFAVMVSKLGLKRIKQVQTEAELRDIERDLKRAQAVAKVGNWRIRVSHDELFWSDETYRIFGVPLSTHLYYKEFLSFVHPDDREMVNREWQQALHGKKYDVEHRIVVDGRIKWVREQAELEFFEDGELSGAFGTVQDITDRKQIEGELLRAKNEWERTFDSVPDLIAIMDTDHRIIRANRSLTERLGMKHEEYLGLRCYEVIHNMVCPAQGCPYSQSLKDGKEHTAEIHEERFGSNFLISTTPLYDEQGIVSGSVHVARDITSQKRMEEELRRSRDELEARVLERTAELTETLKKVELMNKELQEFAFVASHDLQEPLRKIQMFGGMIRDICQDKFNETEREYFRRIENAASRMQQLIQDLLRLSRISTRPEPFVAVDLNKVADEVFHLFEHHLNALEGIIEISALPRIEADESQMRQLFQNLIANALKFQPRGNKPRIRIYADSDENNTYRIFIQDNGIGFDEKYVDKIFSPFQRLHGRSAYEGTGMGLAICRKIIERHGGSITARSDPGKGSTFILTLPVKHGAQEQATL